MIAYHLSLPLQNPDPFFPFRRHVRHRRRKPSPSPALAIHQHIYLRYPLSFDDALNMKLLNDNILYDFTVEQGGFSDADRDSNPLFRVSIRCRKFQAPIRRPVATMEQSLDLSRSAQSSDVDRRLLMSQILAEFEVPARIGEQMSEHFGFFANRLARRLATEIVIPVTVRLDVKVISPEAATGIRTRMETARETAAVPRRRREEEEEAVPARRSSIESLDRVRIGGDVRECAICLEEVRGEAAKMPCGHLFHGGCIVEWLERTHFCPFCRYKMPC